MKPIKDQQDYLNDLMDVILPKGVPREETPDELLKRDPEAYYRKKKNMINRSRFVENKTKSIKQIDNIELNENGWPVIKKEY